MRVFDANFIHVSSPFEMSTRKLTKEERQNLKSLFKTKPKEVPPGIIVPVPDAVMPTPVNIVSVAPSYLPDNIMKGNDTKNDIVQIKEYSEKYKLMREEHQRELEDMHNVHVAAMNNLQATSLEIATLSANIKKQMKFIVDKKAELTAKLQEEPIPNSLIIPYKEHESAVAFINDIVDESNKLVKAVELTSLLPDPLDVASKLNAEVAELGQKVKAVEDSLKGIVALDDELNIDTFQLP